VSDFSTVNSPYGNVKFPGEILHWESSPEYLYEIVFICLCLCRLILACGDVPGKILRWSGVV